MHNNSSACRYWYLHFEWTELVLCWILSKLMQYVVHDMVEFLGSYHPYKFISSNVTYSNELSQWCFELGLWLARSPPPSFDWMRAPQLENLSQGANLRKIMWVFSFYCFDRVSSKHLIHSDDQEFYTARLCVNCTLDFISRHIDTLIFGSIWTRKHCQ